MAYRNVTHREQVIKSAEFDRMYQDWVREQRQPGARVLPLQAFIDTYGRAFFNPRGRSIDPSSTETSRAAFLTLMKATGRIERSELNNVTTWEDWREYNNYP